MSAITGIFYKNGRNVDEKQIKKMNDRLSHRGPDGSAIWCEGPVALGHQMLHTTPESLHEKLPFEEDGLVITADARIDNRKELSVMLEIEDKEEVSDSYFILKAYQKWDEKCPEELLGDFAFAIWDKNQEKLFCARDHMGVKPLYYYLSDDLFIFGSEIKALQIFPEVSSKMNHLMAALYFIPTTQEERNLTLYRDISRLPAASLFNIRQNKWEMKKFWELDPNQEVEMESDEEYIQRFIDLFKNAVFCRSRSCFPLGFELSGGLDSSSIVGIAKKFLANDGNVINTFSLITENYPEDDESFYINKLVDLGDINPTYLIVDQINPLGNAEKILWHLETPFFSQNTNFFWNLYQKMQKKDIRVLFSGYDGDSVLSHGQNYLKELTIKLQIKKLIQEIHYLSEFKNINSFKLLLNKIIFPFYPAILKKPWQNKNREGYFILENKELCDLLDLKEKLKTVNNLDINPNTAKEFHYHLLIQGAHQVAFEYIDKLTAAFSIETRYPFFDKRLVEYCYAIPTEQKFKLGQDRRILRIAMTDILPQEIQWRNNKSYLKSASKENLLKFEKRFIEEIIYNNVSNFEFFDFKEIQAIYDRYKSRSKDFSLNDSRNLWNIITFMIWMQLNELSI